VRDCYAPRRGRLLACALCAACFPALLWSHEGPEHEIEEITKRLEEVGEEASLYVDRAVEYQLLSKYAEAAKDLERAIELDPAHVLAHRELGRVYVRLEKPKEKEALEVLGKGLTILSTPTEHATLLIARAEILLAKNENEKALADVAAAIARHSTSLEWYLLRSRLQARLGKCEERIRGLEEGIERTGSGLLEVELADALLDAGQYERAMAKIEKKLERARWRSSWLIGPRPHRSGAYERSHGGPRGSREGAHSPHLLGGAGADPSGGQGARPRPPRRAGSRPERLRGGPLEGGERGLAHRAARGLQEGSRGGREALRRLTPR
jgi:tetratricopeptide (TPR) repeat protein